MPSPLRLLLATLATVAVLLAPACGDTEGQEGEGTSTTAVEDGRSGTDADESPDVYNDTEQDGDQPDEEGTDAGSN